MPHKYLRIFKYLEWVELSNDLIFVWIRWQCPSFSDTTIYLSLTLPIQLPVKLSTIFSNYGVYKDHSTYIAHDPEWDSSTTIGFSYIALDKWSVRIVIIGY